MASTKVVVLHQNIRRMSEATPRRYAFEGTLHPVEFYEQVDVLDFTHSARAHDEPEALAENAWVQTQNIDAPWRPENPTRSSAVGDVFLVVTDGTVRGFLTEGIGMRQLTADELVPFLGAFHPESA